MDRQLWEILVPTMRPSGKPVRLRFHRIWDEKVRAISGGLTIMSPAKGQWINPDGAIFHERMIPVRVLATREEMLTIIDMTMDYYGQEAVLAYMISSDVILRYRGQTVSG